MNFAKFLRTVFFTEHTRWLLLKTPENILFTGVSMGDTIMGVLARNGLRRNAPNIPSETILLIKTLLILP